VQQHVRLAESTSEPTVLVAINRKIGAPKGAHQSATHCFQRKKHRCFGVVDRS
jgi:hypothetical protein